MKNFFDQESITPENIVESDLYKKITSIFINYTHGDYLQGYVVFDGGEPIKLEMRSLDDCQGLNLKIIVEIAQNHHRFASEFLSHVCNYIKKERNEAFLEAFFDCNAEELHSLAGSEDCFHELLSNGNLFSKIVQGSGGLYELPTTPTAFFEKYREILIHHLSNKIDHIRLFNQEFDLTEGVFPTNKSITCEGIMGDSLSHEAKTSIWHDACTLRKGSKANLDTHKRQQLSDMILNHTDDPSVVTISIEDWPEKSRFLNLLERLETSKSCFWRDSKGFNFFADEVDKRAPIKLSDMLSLKIQSKPSDSMPLRLPVVVDKTSEISDKEDAYIWAKTYEFKLPNNCVLKCVGYLRSLTYISGDVKTVLHSDPSVTCNKMSGIERDHDISMEVPLPVPGSDSVVWEGNLISMSLDERIIQRDQSSVQGANTMYEIYLQNGESLRWTANLRHYVDQYNIMPTLGFMQKLNRLIREIDVIYHPRAEAMMKSIGMCNVSAPENDGVSAVCCP